MRVELDGVSKGKGGIVLEPTSLSFRTGEATFARAETEQRPTVLGLIASGRMMPDTGTVLVDGATDRKTMRRVIALIDAPDVSEPASGVAVSGVVAEELMFAGRASHPFAVARFLESLDLAHLAKQPISTVAPTDRVRLLTELAVLREDVTALVLVSPDRHGGDPLEWWNLARKLAARGYGVLVIAGDASATAINATADAPVSENATDELVPLFQQDWS
ncbi:hypothetical protein ITJ66_04950 [Plantibacter sp. VKM Ac-2885]|uniref:hypothetical protein n=1 Tax=Plantibacter TaxID=190323 RepID=UPI0017874C6F|nr:MULTISPECIES: hypothetical protein [Plantibacter]MBD8101760.1 hypothetical protein [Plantibacter sp. CFBP 8775]MBD8517219.1 hypothetical protein [Plantibacter sp. CFBP 8804]MBF4511829.1 hypothetical protein [Plantibacter sp. VKM Ac-2885]